MLRVLCFVLVTTFSTSATARGESDEDARLVGDARGHAGRAVAVAQCLVRNGKKVRRLARRLARSGPKAAPSARLRLAEALTALEGCNDIPIPAVYPMSFGSSGSRPTRASAPKLRVSLGTVTINSDAVLTVPEATRALRRNLAHFALCVKRQQNVQPRIAGSALFQITVANGRGQDIKTIGNSVTSVELQGCWETRLWKIRFPNTPGENVLRISLELSET